MNSEEAAMFRVMSNARAELRKTKALLTATEHDFRDMKNRFCAHHATPGAVAPGCPVCRFNEARKLLERCLIYVQQDAQMMADITRFSPLSPEDQAKHDTTETDSERLVGEIPEFLKKNPTEP